MIETKRSLSAELLDKLMEACIVEKSRKALRNLKDACNFLETEGVEITVAAVGRYCAGRAGGPVAQSIRNNKQLRSYVIARRAEQSPLSGRRKERSMPVRTGDINVDAHIQTIEFQLAQSKAELRSLRSAIPRIGEFDLPAAIKTGHLIISPTTDHKIPAEVTSAIKTILDPRILAAVGLTMVKTGQIIAPDLNDAVFLSKVQTDALKNLISTGR